VSQERSIVSVAWATVLSRIGGLFRDMVIFALLGLSPWNGAFLFAFTIPNLFRRLLGEGALTSAMIPIYTETLQKCDRSSAYDFLNAVLCRLTMILLVIIGGFTILVFCAWPWLSLSAERALGLTVFLFPYLLCACVAALLCGALNAENSFGWPALTAFFLNLAILSMGVVSLCFWPGFPRRSTLYLCFGVLLGGFLQMLLPWKMLRRRGWKFQFRSVSDATTKRLWQLFFPAVLGAAIAQINVTVSRILAYCFTPSGISTLYLSSRLTELPLGIFVIAISSVAFPHLSHYVALGDRPAFADSYRRAQWAMLMITIPATVGLVCLGKQILQLLFQWGNFSAQDMIQTLPVLHASALGIPFYALGAIAIRAFHAQQNMTTPLRIGVASASVNLLLTFVLLVYWGPTGIAAANSLAALFQWVLLQRALGSTLSPVSVRQPHLLPISVATGGLGLWIFFNHLLVRHLVLAGKFAAFLEIFSAVALGIPVYILILHWLRFREVDLFFAFFQPFRRKALDRRKN
jgi:putative peptidoglycan lipid II flippase